MVLQNHLRLCLLFTWIFSLVSCFSHSVISATFAMRSLGWPNETNFSLPFFSIVFFLLVLHLVTVCGSRSLTFICNRLYVSSTVEKVTHFHWFARLLLMFLLFSSFISFNTLLGDSFSFISFFFLFTRAIPTLCIICTSTTDVGAWFFYFTILHTTTWFEF